MPNNEMRIDAFLPQEMAQKAEDLGVLKSKTPFPSLFALSVLAGAFIGLGAMFSTITAAGSSTLPYGIARIIIGFTFCLGLILVIVGGAELFTGNNLIVMAWASRKVTTRSLLKNWTVVYIGNFIGSIGTAILVFWTKQYSFNSGSIGLVALNTAAGKTNLGFLQAVMLGVLCNVLVCLAIWLSFSARSTTDRILAIIFPVTAFVAASFEHSVANMYFVPYGLFLKYFDPAFVSSLSDKVVDLYSLTWGNFFLANLLPVTIGNIIGGAGLVAVTYWFVYLWRKRDYSC
ncbi:MAG TPA: formate transporter FocA [Anaerolineales bacterium]|nr:formate transporter FocA [Anaerolineales bacterium]